MSRSLLNFEPAALPPDHDIHDGPRQQGREPGADWSPRSLFAPAMAAIEGIGGELASRRTVLFDPNGTFRRVVGPLSSG